MEVKNQPIYGSVIRRASAAAIDLFLIAATIILFGIIMGMGQVLELSISNSQNILNIAFDVFGTFGEQVYYTINVLVFGDYLNVPLAFIVWSIWAILSSLFESSEAQATPGKFLMRLKVTNYSQQRITFMQAFLRNYCKLFSNLFLGMGYLMILITKRRQTLHDIMAGCVIISDAHGNI